jgi:transcriptional regulator with XRE-family HTH domain
MNEWVKKLRNIMKMTQNEFAEKIGFSQTNLSLIEKGKITLTESNIRLICFTFGVNEKWLRSGKGEIFNEFMVKNEQERVLLSLFNQLSPRAKIILVDYAEKIKNDEVELLQFYQKH